MIDYKTPSRARDNSAYKDQYFELSKHSPLENAKRNSSQKNPAENQMADLQDPMAQVPANKQAANTAQRLTNDREKVPHMRVQDSPFASRSLPSSKLSGEVRGFDQGSAKEWGIRSEYLTQNGQEMA